MVIRGSFTSLPKGELLTHAAISLGVWNPAIQIKEMSTQYFVHGIYWISICIPVCVVAM